jgi:hypothetical protein
MAAPARASVVRIGFASRPQAGPPPMVLAGRAIDVEDASGRGTGAAPVVQTLVRLGWTTPRLQPRPAPRTLATTISYPARAEAVAKALARTLPPGVKLADCGDCDGVKLVLGADSAKWTTSRDGKGFGR